MVIKDNKDILALNLKEYKAVEVDIGKIIKFYKFCDNSKATKSIAFSK